MKRTILILTAIAAIALVGCVKGNKRLETGGAYAQVSGSSTNADYAFFAVDLTFKTVYSSVDAAYKFEFDNRDDIWKVSHKVKQVLDKTKPSITKAVIGYGIARQQYKLNPTASNLESMKGYISLLQTSLSIVAAEINQFYKP